MPGQHSLWQHVECRMHAKGQLLVLSCCMLCGAGVVLPLLSQSIMFWQILLNKILRNRELLRVEVNS